MTQDALTVLSVCCLTWLLAGVPVGIVMGRWIRRTTP